jgi:ABC-type uncharacterized transport system ATPase subunit
MRSSFKICEGILQCLALDSISFAADSREIFVLLGSNGAGETTTVPMLEFPRYGYQRVTMQLKRGGWAVNQNGVLLLMR